MLNRIVWSFTLFMFAAHCCAQESGFRKWTTSDGQRSGVRLVLLETDGDRVKLKREDNGKIVTMQKSGLSPADQRFIAAFEKRHNPSATSAPPPANASTDWPQWRGPNRDGKSLATGLLQTWPQNGPRLAWNVTGLGEGYSTPAVFGDMIYVLGTQNNEAYVFALSLSDGNKKWESRIGQRGGGGGFPGPKGTPAIDGDFLYAIGADGSVVCLRRESGQIVWNKNLNNDFGGKHGHWEYAESPLIDGDKLICTPGGSNNTLVALQKSSGQKIWGAAAGPLAGDGYVTAGYASTIAATLSGTRQYIAFLHGGVIGVSANDGKPLWHYDSPANGTANCSTPVAFGNSVFAASGYGTGGGRAQISKQGANWNVKEMYFVNKMQSHHGGFILHDGHIYGTNESALLCIDFSNGEIKWQDRCVGKGSVTMAEDHLYVRGEKGGVALVEATPNRFQEKGKFDQPDRSDKNAWAHPVIAGRYLLLHDQDRMLCYDIGK